MAPLPVSLLLLVLLLLGAAAGGDERPTIDDGGRAPPPNSSPPPPQWRPLDAVRSYFRQLDGDGNGQIEDEEAKEYIGHNVGGVDFDTDKEIRYMLFQIHWRRRLHRGPFPFSPHLKSSFPPPLLSERASAWP